MDFLDDLDTDQVTAPTTYAFNLNTQPINSAASSDDEQEESHQNDEQEDNDEQEENDESNKENRPNSLDFSMKNSLLNPNNQTATQIIPDLDILNKVKQRLFGTDQQQDTQPINPQTQPINTQNETQLVDQQDSFPSFAFQNSSLFAPTQKLASSLDDTQIVAPVAHALPQLPVDSAEIEHNKLPQLSVDLAELKKPSKSLLPKQVTPKQVTPKQVTPKQATPPSNSINNLFVESDEDEAPIQSLTAEQREAKIAKLAERKKQQRLQQEKQLQSELHNTTLTDEENELDAEHYDKSIDSSRIDHQPTRKELQEQEKFINISKRKRQIVPTHTKKVEFTRDKFLDAFKSDDEDDGDVLSMDHEELKSSPVTSPVKTLTSKSLSNDNNNNDEEEDMVLSLIQNKQTSKPIINIKSKPIVKNPIQLYAENLKRQLLSSPTKQQVADSKLIDLDSSDLESDVRRHHPSASSPLPMTTPSTNTSHHMNHQLDDLNQIPELSKETKLMLKQKFSKKRLINQQNTTMLLPANMRSNLMPNKTKMSHHKFLQTLKLANINQLTEWQKSNPYNNIDEAVNEELQGDSLFQREIERVKNIRKKEKLLERAKLEQVSKLNNDEDYDPENPESINVDDVPDSDFDDVPDSDFDDEQDDEDNEDNEDDGDDGDEDEDEDDHQVSARRNKKLVVTDDEEDVQPTQVSRRNDDSYMFGVADDFNQENDSQLIVDHKPVTASSVSIATNKTTPTITQSVKNNENELFRNLKPRTDSKIQSQDVEISERLEVEPLPTELPSFQDLTPTQQATQPDNDEATQADPTQIVFQAGETQTIDAQDDEDDENLIDAVSRGRQQIRKNKLINELQDDEDIETPEQIQARIKMYENKIRRKELKARKRRKEMERKGLKNILEGEAEESEDEWKGIGGADNDESDQANSEDEKMIDNDMNLDLNDQEIRQKFMEQYKIKDQKELEKLIDDVKNHRLSKRAGGRDSLDIEFSDEEDELLLAWKRQIVQEQKQRFMQNKKLRKAAKNERAKAFLGLVDDIDKPSINLDNNSGSDLSEVSDDEEIQSKKKSESPFVDSNNATDKDDDDEDEEIAVTAPKKKRPTLKIKESFVKKTLSFLMVDLQKDEDDYVKQQHISRYQHGVASSDEEIEDISTLKKKSLSNLQSKSMIELDDDLQASKKRSLANSQMTENDDFDDDDEEEMMRLFKKPSIIQSFREPSNGSVSSSGSFSGVTVSKQYKVASGSKASITYMSKNQPPSTKSTTSNVNKKLGNFRSLKVQRIEKGVKDAKSNSSVKGLFKNSGFDG